MVNIGSSYLNINKKHNFHTCKLCKPNVNPKVSNTYMLHKVRNPILMGYVGIYTVYYKDIGEFQILYLQDICW